MSTASKVLCTLPSPKSGWLHWVPFWLTTKWQNDFSCHHPSPLCLFRKIKYIVKVKVFFLGLAQVTVLSMHEALVQSQGTQWRIKSRRSSLTTWQVWGHLGYMRHCLTHKAKNLFKNSDLVITQSHNSIPDLGFKWKGQLNWIFAKWIFFKT